MAEVISEAVGAKPALIRILEIPRDQLYAPSGVVDEATGKELTNLDVVRDMERQVYGGEVFLNANGLMSDEAHKHNTEVTRTEQGVGVIALIAQRPGIDQTTYLS